MTDIQPGDTVECVEASMWPDRFVGQPGQRLTVSAVPSRDALILQGCHRRVLADRFRKVEGHPATLPDAEEDGYAWPGLDADCDLGGQSTITAEAEAAVYGDRGDDYGHPRDHWTRTAILVTGLLQHKLADGEFITPEDWGRIMVAEKLARDVSSVKRDNRIDIAGYALCLDRLETGQ